MSDDYGSTEVVAVWALCQPARPQVRFGNRNDIDGGNFRGNIYTGTPPCPIEESHAPCIRYPPHPLD